MKSNFIQETVVTGVLLVLLVLILNPFNMLWMPDTIHIMVLVALFLVFGIFASFILKEKISDEREGVHRMLAGRAAFLSGSFILIIAIIIQALSHTVDGWLILTLVVMVIAKLTARIYSEKNY